MSVVVVAAKNQTRAFRQVQEIGIRRVWEFRPEAHVGWSVSADPNPVNTRFDTLAFEAYALKSHLNRYTGMFYV